MEDIYELVIDEKIYERILNGKCKYMIFINNRKNQAYKEGNKITFVCDLSTGEVSKAPAEITKLYYFQTMKDLIDMLGKENCGYTASVTSDKLEDAFYRKNKENEIEKYGLVAIEFVLE